MPLIWLHSRQEYPGTGLGLAISKRSSNLTAAACGWNPSQQQEQNSISQSRTAKDWLWKQRNQRFVKLMKPPALGRRRIP